MGETLTTGHDKPNPVTATGDPPASDSYVPGPLALADFSLRAYNDTGADRIITHPMGASCSLYKLESAADDRYSNSWVVAFRGTQDLDSLLCDALVLPMTFAYTGGQCRAHGGFIVQFRTIVHDLESALSSATHVHFTGHSLGGQLAALATLHLARARPELRCTLTTFGAPRTGDEDFNRALEECCLLPPKQYVDWLDPVPHLPPSRVFKRLPGVDTLWFCSFNGHQIHTYIQALRGRAL